MTQSFTENVAPEQSPPLPAAPGRSEAEGASWRRAGRRVLAIGAFIVVALAGALAMGIVPRQLQQRQLDAATTQAADQPPRVTVAVAKRVAPAADRVLPGNALPLNDTALFARTTGYLKRRLVDIGDRVKEGQLLAEISAPDIDDQLAQAKSNVDQAKANLTLAQANADLARITLDRDQRAGVNLVVTLQQLDVDRATVRTTVAQVDATKASIEVNQAMVQRFTDLQGFQKIVAPFQGVITARNVDPGDLISADSPSTTRELFHLMRTDVLRVFVNVPQAFATSIQTGQAATVYRRDEPQKEYAGKVTRTADALDSNTRTLLTQVDVPNPKDQLRPGMYLQVKFTFDRKVFPLMIPAPALATRTQGPRVAVLDDQHRVHYQDVQLGRDYGAEVQVLSGLNDGDTLVVHPGDDIPEGTTVEPVPLPK